MLLSMLEGVAVFHGTANRKSQLVAQNRMSLRNMIMIRTIGGASVRETTHLQHYFTSKLSIFQVWVC